MGLADLGPAAQAAADLAQGASTPLGTAAFAAVHVLAIVLCFPGTIAFEVAAGAIFGFLPGTLLVTAVKGTAAAAAFAIVRLLGDGGAARWLQERVQGTDGEATGWAERLRRGVEQGGFRFCVLARLSPVPSWVNNYVLPLAGVPFGTYFPATVLGMVLPLATNVYSGVAAASLAAALGGGGGGGGLNEWGFVLQALSAASGAAVVQQLAGEALGEAESAAPADDGPGGGPPRR